MSPTRSSSVDAGGSSTGKTLFAMSQPEGGGGGSSSGGTGGETMMMEVDDLDAGTDESGWSYGGNKWEGMGAKGGLGKVRSFFPRCEREEEGADSSRLDASPSVLSIRLDLTLTFLPSPLPFPVPICPCLTQFTRRRRWTRLAVLTEHVQRIPLPPPVVLPSSPSSSSLISTNTNTNPTPIGLPPRRSSSLSRSPTREKNAPLPAVPSQVYATTSGTGEVVGGDGNGGGVGGALRMRLKKAVEGHGEHT